jgi:hypothetical protein
MKGWRFQIKVIPNKRVFGEVGTYYKGNLESSVRSPISREFRVGFTTARRSAPFHGSPLPFLEMFPATDIVC